MRWALHCWRRAYTWGGFDIVGVAPTHAVDFTLLAWRRHMWWIRRCWRRAYTWDRLYIVGVAPTHGVGSTLLASRRHMRRVRHCWHSAYAWGGFGVVDVSHGNADTWGGFDIVGVAPTHGSYSTTGALMMTKTGEVSTRYNGTDLYWFDPLRATEL
ncbi:hypothetical protein MAR_016685 [Mya arenaria]|uniref:Uncharacterized protein n=1 Tax=Mya arenaria TaxID=6604 RepID=A0ABY7E9M4_MYAAR|nr:hypothetical protein MAR_016685 [Mya arenaria]